MEQRVEISVTRNASGDADTAPVDPRRFRHDHPERELWRCIRAYPDNTFDLARPEGWHMERVPGIVPRLWRVIRSGMTVVVAWMRRGQGARQRPYVRGRAGHKLPLGCDVEGIHLNFGVDESRTGREPEGMGIPSGAVRDPNWQTELVGNASSEAPLGTLCLGRLSGRPVGWIACAQGASSGAFSGSSTKRVTCFDLRTGETIWQADKTANTAANQNFPYLMLIPTRGELLLINQNVIGVGSITLERISCCTGETLARTESIQDEAENQSGWTVLADGAALVGWIPTASVGSKSLRLRVWRQVPLQDDGFGEAYEEAYQLTLGRDEILVGSGVTGGAQAGFYWPDLDQAILIVEERQDASPQLVIRAKLVAWEVRTGRILWTWRPHEELGHTLLGRRVFGQLVQRDHEDGSLYYTCRVDAGSADKSYAVKIDARTGRTLWTQEIDAQGATGKFFNGFIGGGGGQGMLGNSFLSHYNYNSAPLYQGVRPVLLSRSTGRITEGPLGWRLYDQTLGPDWAVFVQNLDLTPDRTRFHLATASLQSKLTWEYNLGLARASRTTPDAACMAFWRSAIYGVNWDSSAGGWRVRRWS